MLTPQAANRTEEWNFSFPATPLATRQTQQEGACGRAFALISTNGDDSYEDIRNHLHHHSVPASRNCFDCVRAGTARRAERQAGPARRKAHPTGREESATA